MRLIEKMIDRVRTITHNVRSLALMDVYGRVARLLLELAESQDGQLVIPGRLNQQVIASQGRASRDLINRNTQGTHRRRACSAPRRPRDMHKSHRTEIETHAHASKGWRTLAPTGRGIRRGQRDRMTCIGAFLFFDEVRRSLLRLGHVNGRNVALEAQWGENAAPRLAKIAADLVVSADQVIE